MAYTKIDRSEAKQIRDELNELITAYGKAHGLEISIGNATYSGTDVVFKKVSLKVAGEKSFEDKQNDLDLQMLESQGISLDRNFRGEKVVKYSPRSYKYPVIYETHTGKRFKISYEKALLRFPKAA